MADSLGYVDCEECGREFHPQFLQEHIAWHGRVMESKEISGVDLRDRARRLSELGEFREMLQWWMATKSAIIAKPSTSKKMHRFRKGR